MGLESKSYFEYVVTREGAAGAKRVRARPTGEERAGGLWKEGLARNLRGAREGRVAVALGP